MKTELVQIKSDLIEARELSPFDLFKTGGTKAIVDEIERIANDFEPDLSNGVRRKEVASIAAKVASSKTLLDKVGKELVADIKKQSSAIDAERKYMRDRLDSIKEKVRKPLTDWEEAEEQRKADHIKALSDIGLFSCEYGSSSVEIRGKIKELEAFDVGERWEEFQDDAETTKSNVLASLKDNLAKAEESERQQAEIERLRKIEEEHKANAAKQKAAEEKEAQAKREKEAAEKAKKEAEEKAEREKAEALAKAEADKLKAVEDERARIEAEKLKEQKDAEKREANKKHKAKIHNDILAALQKNVDQGVMGEDLLKGLVVAMAKGEIPHVTINY